MNVDFNVDELSQKYFVDNMPSGVMREIAEFIYEQSPYPVPEISIAGSIGLFAGIVGRQYNFSAQGLNQYIIVVAGTGMGKNAIHTGTSKIVGALRAKLADSVRGELSKHNLADSILGPAEIASGQALLNYLAERDSPCCVSFVGEFGIRLQQITSERAQSHERTLKRALLDLYSRSGAGQIISPMIYADKIKNSAPINSPAFTLVGESTGSEFYGALDERNIRSGLVPRFLVIEYSGVRSLLNKKHALATVPAALVSKLDDILVHCAELAHSGTICTVGCTAEAEIAFDIVEGHATAAMGAGSGSMRQEIWSRFREKIQRLAALAAVAHNHRQPVINLPMMKWATSIVVADAKRMIARCDAGDLGEQDESDAVKQVQVVVEVCRNYLNSKYHDLPKNGATELMHKNATLPYPYIQRTVKRTPFKRDRRGPTIALRETLKEMCELQLLQEMPKNQARQLFQSNSVCYTISDPERILHSEA